MLIELEKRTGGRAGGAVRAQVGECPFSAVTAVESGPCGSRQPDREGPEEPVHCRRCALRRQIGAFIQRRLGDPDLTPATIAEAHHISVRYLYQVFDTHQMTVAAWIRHCRLEHCHRDLADPRLRSRSIRAIAARWGFSDAAHFSRAFRAAYGISPRDHRNRALLHG